MQRPTWLSLALLLFLPLSCELPRSCGQVEAARPIQARLELAAGAVSLDGRPAYTGAALGADAELSTGQGARALARLSDGSAIFLRSDSAVTLGLTEVLLTKGQAWIDAPPSDRDPLVHRVGGVSIAASDAGLDVQLVDGEAVVYVARGLAVLDAPGGRVEVQAGEQARVKGDAAPVVSPVAFWHDWTGGMADNRSASELAGTGTGAIYGVDFGGAAGGEARQLQLERLAVHAVVRDGLAETSVDQTFANDSERDLEGWYWFRVPAGATVTSFATEHDGMLIEGEFVEKKEAAAKYAAAAQTGHAPALLEWVDSRTFRARIYPVAAMGQRRVVLRYLERLPVADGVLRYVYPLQSDDPSRIGEFSLSVDLGDAGAGMEIATLADARVEADGRLVTMRRSGFVPQADFQIEARLADRPQPVRISRYDNPQDSADYVMLRYVPDVDWDAYAERRADVVVVVDTSAAADDDARHLGPATAEAILRGLSPEDRFALVSLDVQSTVLYPAEGLSPAGEEDIALALERLADHAHGGATDLASFFDTALGRLHDAEQPAVIYVGDGLATSGDLSGDQLRERLRRALSTSPARLFTVGVGEHANQPLLSELARTGGGQALWVASPREATERALRLAAAIKTPTITGLDIEVGAGMDEVFVSGGGKVGYGEEVVLLARTHHDLPHTITVSGTLAGEPFRRDYEAEVELSATSSFVPRFWAAESMRRELGAVTDPAEIRGRLARLGIEYGLMTPYTSILALESEQAYRQMGIERRYSPLRGTRLASLDGCALSPSGGPVVVAVLGMGCGSDAPPSEQATVDDASYRPSGAATPQPAMPGPALDGAELAQAGADGIEEGLLAGPKGGIGDTEAEVEVGRRVSRSSSGRRNDKMEANKADPTERQDDADWNRRSQPISVEVSAGTCSDWASRPLGDRTVIWRRRFATAGPDELLERYRSAKRACELPEWRSEQVFLRLLAGEIRSEAQAGMVLTAFAHDRPAQRLLGRLILRGTVDPRIAATVTRALLGDDLDWPSIDLRLAGITDLNQRIELLRRAMAEEPDDPQGAMRLIRLLAQAGPERQDELLVQCRRLQDQGLMTPQLARQVGDILAEQGLDEEAVRSYSEIVEFQPDSLATRRLLGDIYLANGWYGQAYRQYQAITEQAPDDAHTWLRLASAAGGEGRVDEALRIERKVASAAGTPGPTDARAWARLMSAARLARLIAAPPTDRGSLDTEQLADGLRRKVKELGLFRAPGTLVLLTWEDLDADIALSTWRAGAPVVVGAPSDAAPVGLGSVLLPRGDLSTVELRAHLRGMPRDRDLALRVHELSWDGSTFEVAVREVTLDASATQVVL